MAISAADVQKWANSLGDSFAIEHGQEFADQYGRLPQSLDEWNAWKASRSGGGGGAGGASGYPQLPSTNVGGIDYARLSLDSQIAQAQQAYLLMRLQMLEIPEFQAQTETQRRQIALDAINTFANQTGWIDPQALQGFMDWEYKAPATIPNSESWFQQMTDWYNKTKAAGGDVSQAAWMKAFQSLTGADAQTAADMYNRGTSYIQTTGKAADAATQQSWLQGYMQNQPTGSSPTSQGYQQQSMQQFAGNGGGAQFPQLGQPGNAQYDTTEYNLALAAQRQGQVIPEPQRDIQYINNGARDPNWGTTNQLQPGTWQPNVQGIDPGFDPNYYQQQAQGYQGSMRPTMQGAAQLAAPRGISDNMSLLGLNMNQLPGQQGTPTLALQQLGANPAALPQTMMLYGLSPEQTAQTLQNSPWMQQYINPATVGTGAPLQNFAGQANGFQFAQGQQMPVEQTLQWLKTNSPYAQLATGLAAFSGQDTNNFWGNFRAALPSGQTNPLTKFL